MESHEVNGMEGRLPARARSVAAAAAIVTALVLALPGVASAARSYGPSGGSVTITQNTSMIVNVSGTSSATIDAVSWGDVSWGDVSWADLTLAG